MITTHLPKEQQSRPANRYLLSLQLKENCVPPPGTVLESQYQVEAGTARKGAGSIGRFYAILCVIGVAIITNIFLVGCGNAADDAYKNRITLHTAKMTYLARSTVTLMDERPKKFSPEYDVWAKKMLDKFDLWHDAYIEAQDITPTPKYEAFHKTYLSALKAYDEAATQGKIVVNTNDLSVAKKATDAYESLSKQGATQLTLAGLEFKDARGY